MKLRLLIVVAAVAVLVSAYVHWHLWSEGFRYVHMVGPAFLVNAVAGVVIAVLLVVWRHWIPLLLAAGFGTATLGAFVLSTTVGLYGLHQQWSGGFVWSAAVSEGVAILASLTALWGRHAWSRDSR